MCEKMPQTFFVTNLDAIKKRFPCRGTMAAVKLYHTFANAWYGLQNDFQAMILTANFLK